MDSTGRKREINQNDICGPFGIEGFKNPQNSFSHGPDSLAYLGIWNREADFLFPSFLLFPTLPPLLSALSLSLRWAGGAPAEIQFGAY